jgi:hypothetical protein
MKTKRKIKKAIRSLTLNIAEEHAERGEPRDRCNCVVAQALQDLFGESIVGVDVGPNKTKIYFDEGPQIQYKTPPILRDHLVIFDETHSWNLPVGPLTLLPYPKNKSKGRHDLKNPDRGSSFQGRQYIPTRKASIKFD